MSIRVHVLAKELKMTSKELIAQLALLKVPVKNHMSSLDAEMAGLVRQELSDDGTVVSRTPAPATEPEPAPAPATEPEPAPAPATEPEPTGASVPVVDTQQQKIHLPMTVKELAEAIGERINTLISKLIGLGVMATINQSLGEEVVQTIATEYGFEVEGCNTGESIQTGRMAIEQSGAMVSRAPIVTFMGHVDHGKTSLMDAIRKTNVIETESGGITQHIGAYEVQVKNRGSVTFLDTPGHAAFSAMRARGATVTDVVVLVVAADDGVMPQTEEAIDHAKAAGVPLVVAINKMDKPGVDIDRVKRELTEHGLVPEDWGGKTVMIAVSALTGAGIPDLLEMLHLESELLELRADPSLPARGTVLEGHLSKGSGSVANVLVQNGTLRIGDLVLVGACHGRVRALINDRGQRVTETGPASPVEILGLEGVPEAGDQFFVKDDEREVRRIVAGRIAEQKQTAALRTPRIALADVHDKIASGSIKELKLVLKADVQGSLEALRSNLEQLATKEVRLTPIHVGVGDINESDIMLAAASEAIVLGFHVTMGLKAQEQAAREGVDVHLYQIIYEATEEIRKALEGLLEPEQRETHLGTMEVKQVFKVSKVGMIAGGMVVQGKLMRSASVARVMRNNTIIFEGKLASLKRYKDDAREVLEGTECGLNLVGFTGYEPGDRIALYHVEQVARTL